MFFQLVPGGFSDLINQNNYSSNWKKLLGFRNLQERPKKLLAFILTRVLLKKESISPKLFLWELLGSFLFQLNLKYTHLLMQVGLYKTIPLMLNSFVSFTKTFFQLSMKNPRCIFQETIHQDLYNLILQLYVLLSLISRVLAFNLDKMDSCLILYFC